MKNTVGSNSLTKGKILIVDDEPPIRALLEAMMLEAGNIPFSTGDPSEAKELCKKHKIDVVLLDVNMPRMDGIEVCRELQAFDPNIPVIMISGNTDNAIQQKTITNGAIDFITKPLEAANVLIRVKNAVRMRNMQTKMNQQLQQIAKMSEVFSEKYDDLKDVAFDKQKTVSDVLADYLISNSEAQEIDPFEALFTDDSETSEQAPRI